MRPGWRRRLFPLQRVSVFAIMLGVAGCVGGGPARRAVSTQVWSEQGLSGRRIITEHFDTVSTLGDAEFEAALPVFLEATYKRYHATLPAPSDASTRLTTYIFGTRSEWARFTRHRFPARCGVYSRIRSGGFTEGDTSVSFYVSRATTLATLAHEGWHQYVGSRFETQIPAWLNEGLACYHEAVEFAGSMPRFTPQRNTFRINSLREAIQRDTLMSLREVVDTNAGQVISRRHRDITQIYYAQAWALVTFLRHGARGRYAPAFDRMLSDIADGTFAVRVSAAKLGSADAATLSSGGATFRTYFDRTPDDLADEYYDHLIRVSGF